MLRLWVTPHNRLSLTKRIQVSSYSEKSRADVLYSVKSSTLASAYPEANEDLYSPIDDQVLLQSEANIPVTDHQEMIFGSNDGLQPIG